MCQVDYGKQGGAAEWGGAG
uniref:Uncharacterized protein n=1 Tax=Anguilla anguilla TaxID=7936 RepID=A0A0E9TPU0_ANGAN